MEVMKHNLKTTCYG